MHVPGVALAILLLIDGLLLVALPLAPYVLLGVLGLVVLASVVQRPAQAFAFAVASATFVQALAQFGGPDLGPLRAGQALVLLPLAVIGWRLVWGLGSSRAEHRELTHAITRAIERLLRSPLFWTTVGLAALMWFGRAWSSSPGYGANKTNGFILFNVLFLIGGAILLTPGIGQRSENPRHFVMAAALLFAVIGVLGFLNYFLGFTHWENRLRVLGLGPIGLARFMGSALFCWLALRHAGCIGRTQFWAVAAVLLFVFYFTGSRGPLASFLAASVVWAALSPFIVSRRVVTRWLLLVSGLLGVAGLVLLVEFGPWSVTPFVGHDLSNLQRWTTLTRALSWFDDAGWLGVGTGGFSALMGFGDTRFYPHNILFEIWIENGLLGFGAFLVFLGVFAWLWVRAWRRVDHHADRGAAAAPVWLRLIAVQFTFALANAQFSGDTPSNSWIWLWAGALLAWGRPKG